MKRKVITAVCIIIATPILFLAICALILFLAPGVEIFGVRYVAEKTSVCEIDERLADINEETKIFVNTNKVPVTIEYSSESMARVSFHQVYRGLTRSHVSQASLKVDYDKDKNELTLTTSEIVPWLYSNNDETNYFFKLYIPSGGKYDGLDLTISSKSSPVSITGPWAPVFESLSVTTSSGLSIENRITARNFEYNTSKAITLDKNKIECANATLSSTSNNVTVQYDLGYGNLSVTTNGGDIRFVSCGNLSIKTESGNVGVYGEGLPSVKRSVNFESRSGSLKLGNVGVEDDSSTVVFTSVSGSFSATSIVDGDLRSERGKIDIGKLRSAVITSTLGNVRVGEVTSQINILGKNGSVELGYNGDVSNPTVETTTGTILASNTSGKVRLQSSSNNVTLYNKDATEIELVAGKTLKATALRGTVSAESNSKIDLTFAELTDDVSVYAHANCKSIVIDATCANHEDVSYSLNVTGTKGQKVYFGGVEAYSSTYPIESVVPGQILIKVFGQYAEVVLKLK